jgi:hypothetical protein
MCDLDTSVLVDDAVDFISRQLESKDDECRTLAIDSEHYEQLFKDWLKEVLTELAEKCQDLGYHRSGGKEGVAMDYHERLIEKAET